MGRLAIAALVALAAGCGMCAQAPRPPSVGVKYEVVGKGGTGSDARADVSYQDGRGRISRESGVKLPWAYSFTAQPGATVSISARLSKGEGVTVNIYRDGALFMTSTGKGERVGASASGGL